MPTPPGLSFRSPHSPHSHPLAAVSHSSYVALSVIYLMISAATTIVIAAYLAPSAVPLLGGRYRFIKKIGRGSFALLVRCEDTYHPARRHVAIKVMHAQHAAIGEQEGGLLRRVNAADPLDVSRVVRCLSTFYFEGHFCIVFELLSATPLRHCVEVACQVTTSRKTDPAILRLSAIRKITAQLVAALAFLQQQNIIHADVKPENVLLRDGAPSSTPLLTPPASNYGLHCGSVPCWVIHWCTRIEHSANNVGGYHTPSN